MESAQFEALIKRLDYICKMLKSHSAIQPQAHIPTRPQRSDELDKLIPALIKVQMTLEPAIKDAKGHKAKYCTIGAILEASQDILLSNGLVITDYLEPQGERGNFVCCLMHISGQYIESRAKIILKEEDNPQAFGLCMTYFRRYLRVALLGMLCEDDDAELASGVKK